MPCESVKPLVSIVVMDSCPASGGVIIYIAGNSVAISSVSGCGGSLPVENRIRSNPCISGAGVGDIPFKVLWAVGRQSESGYGERWRSWYDSGYRLTGVDSSPCQDFST